MKKSQILSIFTLRKSLKNRALKVTPVNFTDTVFVTIFGYLK